jgi:hypothetical protein
VSPVSRGRKPKKSAKRATRPAPARTVRQLVARPASAFAVLQNSLGSEERPARFDDSIRRVLDGAAALVAATGPRELEQLTTELVGAEVRRDRRFRISRGTGQHVLLLDIDTSGFIVLADVGVFDDVQHPRRRGGTGRRLGRDGPAGIRHRPRSAAVSGPCRSGRCGRRPW